MAKVYKYTFKVRNMGGMEFPVDMLRYACCFPANEESSGKVSRSLNPMTRPDDMTGEVVVLSKYGGKTTGLCRSDVARFASLGWHVVQFDNQDNDNFLDSAGAPWLTRFERTHFFRTDQREW